jgi:hypothetical protein
LGLRVRLDRPSSAIGNELREWPDVWIDAGTVESAQVGIAIFDANDHPGKPPEASIAFIRNRAIRPLPSG